MTKRLRASLITILSVALAVCLLFGVLQFLPKRVSAASTAENVSHATVAVHDPSIVLAYEGEDGRAYPDLQTAEKNRGGSATKTYYVFGTQLAFAKSTDLVNWTPFETNLHIPTVLSEMLSKEAAYSGNNVGDTAQKPEEKLRGNCWAPDVIWNRAMQKWCMYLTVNGNNQKSVIVLLVADDLDGAWSYVGGVVYSRITDSNISDTDYQKVTGKTSVDPKYAVYRNNSANLLYGVNAIDAAVTYDDEGNLWMVYGSWFGGIYMLRLDPQTGLRDYDYKYQNEVLDGEGNDITDTPITQSSHPNTFKVVSDEYLGIHIAGGHSAPEGGEGPYIEKIGQYYYLFVSYGGYAPDGGYNMRVFRSEKITGPYVDAMGRSSIFSNVYPDINDNNSKPNGMIGNRLMTGYTWPWWDFSYVAQGHNSAFVDDDGKAYLVYHNKYMDGTVFHVMKVHELLVNEDGWLVVSPFESNKSDSVATGLEMSEIAGDYGVLFMQKDNGAYKDPVTEKKYTLAADGTVTGEGEPAPGTWTYDRDSGKITLTFTFDGKSTVHKGYLLRQTMEGTNISTLAFTAISPDPNNDATINKKSVRTYWGYKYPDAEQAGQYVANEYALPDAMGTGAEVPDTVTSTLWNNVTVSYVNEGGKIAAKSGGTTVMEQALAATDDFLHYAKVNAEQKFFKVNANGVSISFDYKGYQDDWTEVLAGDNFRINLSVLERAVEGKWGAVFEFAAGGDYTAFFGSGRATISFNSDGTIAFYRDGKLQMRFGVELTFSESAGTVKDLCNDVINAFKAGKVRATYPMENVVIAAAVEGGSVYDTEPYLSLTDPSIKMIGTVKGSASKTEIPAVSDAVTNGFAISFDLTEAFQRDPLISGGLNGDWRCVVIGAGGYNITLPNLDSFGIDQKNKVPAADNLKNGGTWDSFLNTTCFVTVSVSKTEGIKFYKNGLLVIEYPYSDTYVQGFVDAILPIVQDSGFTSLGGSGTEIVYGENLIVSSALTDAQAQSIYADYQASGVLPAEPTKEVLNIDNGYYTVFWNPATEGVNTNTGWWVGAFGATTLPAGNNAVQMRYYNDRNFLEKGIQFHDAVADKWGTFHAFSTLSGDGNSWADGLQTGGSYVIYENGVRSENQTLHLSSDSFTEGQWIGNYTITFLHYGTTLYVICDFTRDGTNERYTVEYKFTEITGEITVQLSGYAVGLTGTVAVSESIEFSEQAPQHNCDVDGHEFEFKSETTTCLLHTSHFECKYCDEAYDVTDFEGVKGHSYTITESVNGCDVTVKFECSKCAEGDFTMTYTTHSINKVDQKAATCTEDGNNEYWECSKCHTKFKDAAGNEAYTDESYLIKAQGHKLTKHEAHAATCTAKGNNEYWECTSCHKFFNSDADKNTDDHVVAKDSWVTEMTAHTLKEHAAKDATCTENGNKVYWECDVCHKKFSAQTGGTEYTEENQYVLQATGHTFTTKHEEAKDPTCTEAGNHEYWECDVCHKKFSAKTDGTEYTDDSHIISATGHTLKEHAAVAPDCLNPGNDAYWECEKCGKFFGHATDTSPESTPIEEGSWVKEATGHKGELKLKDGGAATSKDHLVHIMVCDNPNCPGEEQNCEMESQTTRESCNVEGTVTYTCPVCDFSYSETLAAGEHSWDLSRGEVKKAPTCTAKGETEYTCTVCGEKETRETEMIDHSLTKHEAHAATCTAKGNDEYWECTSCHQFFDSADDTSPESPTIEKDSWVTDMIAHTLKEHAESAATCTETGNHKYWECSACHKKFKDNGGAEEYTGDSYIIPAKGHTFTTNHVEAKDPTCTEAGNYEYWVCDVCHKKFSAKEGGTEYPNNSYVRDMIAHTLTKHEAKDATCTETGNDEYWECTSCHKKFTAQTGGTEITDESYVRGKVAHSLTKHEAHAATCTAEGNNEYWECDNCGKFFGHATDTAPDSTPIEENSWVIGKVAHSLTKHEANAATCTAKGNNEYWECTECGKFFNSDADKNTDDHVVTKDSWVTDMTAHTLTKHEAKAATCTEAGNNEYWECDVCHKKFTAQTNGTEITDDSYIIQASGHSLTKHEAHAATCTEAGNSEYWECSKCHKYFNTATDPDSHVIAEGSWTLDKLAHTLSEHARVAATCTQAGTEAYWECTSCHKKFTAQTGGTEITEAAAIPALGHDWADWTIGADGTETHSCNRCDETETRTNTKVAAFHTAVGAIAGATTAETKLAAIKAAVTAYNALSAAEKTAVATDYATLESAISAYNTAAEAANAAYNSAADIAVRVLSTALAALGALAAVWVILKRGL